MLGGTSFVGRAIVDDALRTGSGVTLFSRGRTGTELFPGLPRLRGDRDTGDYAALRGGRWDAVVDVSGYVPRHVGQAMDALGDRVARYLFISQSRVRSGTSVSSGSGSGFQVHDMPPGAGRMRSAGSTDRPRRLRT